MTVDGVFNIQPQPPIEENTRWFDAGVIAIGVEYREVNPDVLAEVYGENDADMAEIAEHTPAEGFVDEGVSLHVRGTASAHEFVRFDIFDSDPHYHYVRPTGHHNKVVRFDRVADGDMLAWAVDRLRHRLPQMLTEAGGEALISDLESARVERAVDEVAALAEAARRAQHAARNHAKAD